jgi:hypothetical protein
MVDWKQVSVLTRTDGENNELAKKNTNFKLGRQPQLARGSFLCKQGVYFG